MRVEVDMPNANHALLPGMYVNVAFKLQPRGLVEVPAAALIFRPKATQVARVDAHGKIEFQNVTIARDNGSLVELGSGVKPGDRLVLNISSQIAEGQSVTANDSDAAPTARSKRSDENRCCNDGAAGLLTGLAVDFRRAAPRDPTTTRRSRTRRRHLWRALRRMRGIDAAHAPTAPDPATWWRALNDPELDSLVERAIKSNPDLEIALTRLQQARNYEAVVVGPCVA